ncbi:hypothetical protein ACFQVC_16575 [Streptomyces monticola]|uniref:Lipoprotein n=1 Tax=Streptomyces monticola TaxID=2666263 RepID=A0ABW2JJY5_9ACTN
MVKASRRAAVLCAGLLLGALSGCADAEGLHSDGPLEDVTAPLRLWQDSTPAPAAPEQRPGRPAAVPGVPEVASGDMRKADALAVVKADIATSGAQDRGSGRLVDARAVKLMAACSGDDCPVREPVHHDLTGDGKGELITAVDIDGRTSELRVYTAKERTVTRILARRGVLEGVEVAAGHLAIREPTSNSQYVSVSDYVWEEKNGTMALWSLTLDECRSLSSGDGPCPKAGS